MLRGLFRKGDWLAKCVLLLLLSALATAQNASLESRKRRAFSMIRDALDPTSLSAPEKFDKAAGELILVWEQERPPSAEVAENLAIAYMNGDRRRTDRSIAPVAWDLMNKAIQLGGSASFLANHSHERVSLIQGGVRANYCSGKLSVRPGSLVYTAMFGEKASEHSFELTPGDIKLLDGQRRMLHVRFVGKSRKENNFHIFPRTNREEDAEALIRIVRNNLAVP